MTMQPISCQGCGREVLVEKFSAAHTSIQWPFDARECPFIAARDDAGTAAGFGANTHGCEQLLRTIDQAFAEQSLTESGIELPVGQNVPRLH
ncbi:hypothetical protein [Gordonia metallireducens]|uniref:hypothetical protein n=1 Tax=Gordonia metallireducens TaxID=2897779 RepID=UPI001E3991A3|nr:hypothetical protein [Gordonia metallireducens]